MLELAIPGDLPPATKIQHMEVRFRTAQAEVTRVQEELTLQVVELCLKARPPTPPVELECFRGEILVGLETMRSFVRK